MINVPSVLEREKIPQEAIDDVVQQIAEQFAPHKIILFGSYARGCARPESDVDLLVIMDTPLREIQQAIEIENSLNIDLFGLDLLVKTPQLLKERLEMGDPFLAEIMREGKVVWTR